MGWSCRSYSSGNQWRLPTLTDKDWLRGDQSCEASKTDGNAFEPPWRRCLMPAGVRSCPWHHEQRFLDLMRLLMLSLAAASLLLSLPGKAQSCMGHTGWAAMGYRQGIAMRWFKEHGRTYSPEDAEKQCNNNPDCWAHLSQRCAYR